MTEQFPTAIGTVAQEAARLIEDMATMARSTYSRSDEPRRYAAPPAQEPVSPEPPQTHSTEPAAENDQEDEEKSATPSEPAAVGACSMCGAERDGTQGYDSSEYYDGSDRHDSDDSDDSDDSADPHNADTDGRPDSKDIPYACRLCPVCKGIELLRSVRPETVDLLADLALSLATSLRDVAKRSRASNHGSSPTSASGASSQDGRPKVQDIIVDDESEG